jgi:hypothetical protein
LFFFVTNKTSVDVKGGTFHIGRKKMILACLSGSDTRFNSSVKRMLNLVSDKKEL